MITIKTFGFEVAHGYEILKGYVSAENKDSAIKKILNQEWDDILDEFDLESDEPIKDYEIMDIWEL